MRYPITITPDEDGVFVVEFVDLMGVTQGDTIAEAQREAEDCLVVALSFMMRHDKDIPEPSDEGEYFVEAPPTVALKVELYRSWRAAGITKAELARRVGQTPQQAQRLFDLKHVSKLEQLDAAFRALGQRLTVSVEAVA